MSCIVFFDVVFVENRQYTGDRIQTRVNWTPETVIQTRVSWTPATVIQTRVNWTPPEAIRLTRVDRISYTLRVETGPARRAVRSGKFYTWGAS